VAFQIGEPAGDAKRNVTKQLELLVVTLSKDYFRAAHFADAKTFKTEA
jgi:hypothetical protein